MNKVLVKLLKPKQSIKCKSTNLYLWDPEVADTLITTMQAIRDEILKLVDNESVDTLLNIADDVVKVANISEEITTLSGYVAEITQLATASDSLNILAENIESILTDAENIESIKTNAENIDSIISAKDNADRAEENATKAENAVALVEAQVKEVITEYLPQIEEKGNEEVVKITTEGNSQYNKIQTEGDTQYNRIKTQGNIELEKITTEGNTQVQSVKDEGDLQALRLAINNLTGIPIPYPSKKDIPVGFIPADGAEYFTSDYPKLNSIYDGIWGKHKYLYYGNEDGFFVKEEDLLNGELTSINCYNELYQIIIEGEVAKTISKTELAGMNRVENDPRDYETFNVPNLTDRTIWGSTIEDTGVYRESGAPNIEGQVDGVGNVGANIYRSPQGSFGTNVTTHFASNTVGATKDNFILTFNASQSNKIYGSSTIIQPPSALMRFIIKYE